MREWGKCVRGQREARKRYINGQVTDWATEAPLCWEPSEKPYGTCLRFVSVSATQDGRPEHASANTSPLLVEGCLWGVNSLVLVNSWQ